MFIKIPALGIRGYTSDPFNNFDCLIVTISIFEIIAEAADLDFGEGGISALRTFRLFRIFKLAREWEDLQLLLAAMVTLRARQSEPHWAYSNRCHALLRLGM